MLTNTDNKTYFFINRQQMHDVVEYEKKAYFINKLESLLPKKKFSEFLSDLDKKRSCEIRTALQLSRVWLEQLFGYKGDIQVNILSHGTDAIYVSDDGSQSRNIELKMFSTLKTGTNLNGSEKTSPYHDGHRYWDIADKSWKFRTTAIPGSTVRSTKFEDDCAILMVIDARTNDLVEAIYVDQLSMQDLLDNTRMNSEGAIQICYRHVKEFDHMQGNKAPVDRNQQIVDAAELMQYVTRKNTKSSYYSQFQPPGSRFSIGKTKAEVARWLIDQSKHNTELADFISFI